MPAQLLRQRGDSDSAWRDHRERRAALQLQVIAVFAASFWLWACEPEQGSGRKTSKKALPGLWAVNQVLAVDS